MTLILMALAGICWGWLISGDARLLDPLRRLIEKVLYHPPTSTGPPLYFEHDAEPRWAWAAHRYECPICTGTDGSVVAWFCLGGGLDWQIIPYTLAAVGIHLVYSEALSAYREAKEI